MASCRISARFFSPPEKPSFRYRLTNAGSIFSSSTFSRMYLPKSLTFIGSSRRAFTAMRRKLATDTPGIVAGYWKARNRPARARSSGSASVRSSPLNRIWPSVTS